MKPSAFKVNENVLIDYIKKPSEEAKILQKQNIISMRLTHEKLQAIYLNKNCIIKEFAIVRGIDSNPELIILFNDNKYEINEIRIADSGNYEFLIGVMNDLCKNTSPLYVKK
ncbi:hypothetical protein [Bacillus wiedmannii]|uniref:hypothetical protein n=1 Tax=Bacillus wiedmannii TaxID=1890302 RepID=UPI000BFD50ED|nr:hypothetical protein [Bacillus wiedmannii]PHE70551.1 hypothetical protein COF77_25395 [Bacillus wiedmannii]